MSVVVVVVVVVVISLAGLVFDTMIFHIENSRNLGDVYEIEKQNIYLENRINNEVSTKKETL